MKKNSFFKEYILSLREKRKRAVEIRKQCRKIEQMTIELSQNLKYAEAKENKKNRKRKGYTMVSVFPNEEIMERAFSTNIE